MRCQHLKTKSEKELNKRAGEYLESKEPIVLTDGDFWSNYFIGSVQNKAKLLDRFQGHGKWICHADGDENSTLFDSQERAIFESVCRFLNVKISEKRTNEIVSKMY